MKNRKKLLFPSSRFTDEKHFSLYKKELHIADINKGMIGFWASVMDLIKPNSVTNCTICCDRFRKGNYIFMVTEGIVHPEIFRLVQRGLKMTFVMSGWNSVKLWMNRFIQKRQGECRNTVYRPVMYIWEVGLWIFKVFIVLKELQQACYL